MKRTFSVLLAFMLCIWLFGCSNQKTAENTPVKIDYDSATVSFLGPEGTYTQEACEKFFDGKGRYIPYETVSDAVQALAEGKSSYAVIPQENTIGGAVIDYVDTLISSENISVVGEVELPISQNLLVLPGTALTDIKTVYSHKQGIAQGKEWLSQNLPDAEVIEASSTAEGAKTVADGKDKSCAAIASAGCADVYGLEILAAGIQNNDNNKTRFYVLSKDEPATATADRLAFTASGSAKDLPELTAEMNKLGITLIALHDRPEKTELGNYCYLIECSDCSYEDYQKLTEDSDFAFRYLGSFSVK
ncbi:MAG: hypothetical protein J5964_05025 [Eubacterium sp.]|nr:hypothetical protein [Eubacterium sp.]